MFDKILKLSMAITFLVAVGCAKKVKEDEKAGAGTPGPIVETPMTFNPAGSDSGSIPGLSTVHFEYDSARIDDAARGVLKSNADWMKTNAKYTVQVEGHCDSRGSVEYNLALGERRAKAVKDYLVSLGVDAGRLTIISFGEEKPLEVGDTEDVYRKNRRANFMPLTN